MRTPVVVAGVFLIAASAAARQRAVRPIPAEWIAPQCTTVSGLAGFYFTRDETLTVSGNDQTDPVDSEVIAVLSDVPNRLFAVRDDAVYESNDAGCIWHVQQHVGVSGFTHMRSAPGSLAYAWSDTNPVLLRITATSSDIVSVPEPLLALGAEGAHLVAVGAAAVHESFDGGATWNEVDALAANAIAAAVDPHDILHIAVGYHGGGAFSRDGGRTWQTSDTAGDDVISLAFSPSNPDVLWMMSLTPGVANGLHRSADGGATFPLVVQTSQTNQGLRFTLSALFPHPYNDSLVAAQSWRGLVIINAANRAMFAGQNHYWDSAIWSPIPGVMYLTTETFVGQLAK